MPEGNGNSLRPQAKPLLWARARRRRGSARVILFANPGCAPENNAMPPQSDEFIPTRVSLLHRLKNWDDQESWKIFFETYWKLLYSVARRSGLAEAEAQDIVQETIF